MIGNDKKIAIIGMSCRLPGKIKTPDDYWSVLINGKDVVTEVSHERWGTEFYSHPNKQEPGKSYTFAAGVLDDIDLFDASFFGISPREAEQMDPQQRLLLELAWEAFEDAAIKADSLKGSDCAVYIGIASNDYAHRRTDDLASLDAYTMTGNTASVASNRISYTFDLRGPSISVDTACSSSLVAIHQACKSLWTGEASTALTGGINMLVHPFPFVGFSKASMLSPDGRCKAFDDTGNGYVRAEGAGMLLLKPLEQAIADGDNIHAVIVNSGVNCDGSTSGITVPGMETQGALLDHVYKDTGITPDDISYLEAHGTGTAVGDPLEATALGNSFGKKRSSDKPLLIGSAKTNLGHLETASGMAGLLKAVLTLKNKTIPASLHFKKPNQNIDFSDLNLRVITEITPLPTREKPHYAGVNSFGFGGANAHVLIEEYKPQNNDKQGNSEATIPPLFISAKTEQALIDVAASYAKRIESDPSDYYNIAFATQFKKNVHQCALSVTGADVPEIISNLDSLIKTGSANNVTKGTRLTKSKMAFVFTGNGCQWQGMGQALYATNETFKASFDEVASLLLKLSDNIDLKEELLLADDETNLVRTEVAQPLLFALQVSIVNFLSSYGIKPSAVVGHSVGEVAAAWCSGALSLEQAVQVIHFRSQAQSLTRGMGRMAAVGLGKCALLTLLEENKALKSLELAGENSPKSTTIAGDLKDLEKLKDVLEKESIFYHLLDLDYAFHSIHMETVKPHILRSLERLKPRRETVPFISSVTGKRLKGSKLNAEYWWNNIRQPVQFSDAVNHLVEDNTNVFVEVGPHPILRNYVNECLKQTDNSGLVLETLKRKQDSETRLRQSAMKILLSGCNFEHIKLFPFEGSHTSLPAYPWQRERHWYPLTPEGYDLVNRKRLHPLLGYRLKESEIIWENDIDIALLPYLADHVVDDAIVFPAAAFIEMALAANSLWTEEETCHLEMIEIPTPILFEPDQAKKVRFHLDPDDGSFKILSRDRLSDESWTQNATGRILGRSFKKSSSTASPSYKTENAVIVSSSEHYALATKVGLDYGPQFQAIDSVKKYSKAAQAFLILPTELANQIEKYFLHPSLLDSGFQVLVDICKEAIDSGEHKALIPIQIGTLHLLKKRANHVKQVKVEIINRSPRSVVANFILLDEKNEVLAIIENCRFRQVQFKKALPTTINQYCYQAKLSPHQLHRPKTPKFDTAKIINHARDYLSLNEEPLGRTTHFQEYCLLIDMMAVGYAHQALLTLCPDYKINLSKLKNITVEQQHPLLNRLIVMLQESELLDVTGGSGVLSKIEDISSPAEIWQHIIHNAPAYLPELQILTQCGEKLPGILTGTLTDDNPISSDNSGLLEQLFESSQSYRLFNDLVISSIESLVQQFPPTQRCNLLVISDYPDQLCPSVLSFAKKSPYIDLVIASQSETRLSGVSRATEEYDWASAVLVDLNDLEKISDRPFDIVLAAHVLHKANDLSLSLSKLNQLINKDGILLCLERSADKFTDLTFGTDPDWWNDHQSRLMTPSQWQLVLEDCHFLNSDFLVEADSVSDEGVFLLVAQNNHQITNITSESPNKEKWLILSGNNTDSLHDSLSSVVFTSATFSEKFESISENKFLIDPSSSEDYFRLLSTDEFDRILYLGGFRESELSAPINNLQPLLLATEQLKSMPQLIVITECAAVAEESVGSLQFAPMSSPLWGFGRVIMNEYPDLNTRLIDIQTSKEELPDIIADLSTEIIHDDNESEVIIAQGSRYVLRMESLIRSGKDSEKSLPAMLDFKIPGAFKNLYWKELHEVALRDNEIEIKPIASGLNFRDVMYAMGLLSDEAVENGFAGPTLGMEVAGTITRIGSEVDEFKVGDSVLGFAPACFSNRVITETTATAHKPQNWNFEEAATVPTAFFTVYYALIELAKLRKGERVLIHGASGGVGLAAIQLARHLGAEIFAAAGTPEKRAFVKSIGADHVLDSRSLAFADDILALTEGDGVDVVLNSVYGEAVNRNLSILKPFGRFLELGKRDFYENSRIGLRPFRNNITYYGIDADQLLIERPALAKELFTDLMQLFENGQLHPLPHRVFGANRIQDAFRFMQQSRQIGKVIINLTEPLAVEQDDRSPEALKLDKKAIYLVTGGLSGFGLETAKWLVEKGAKHLYLLGRNGATTESTKSVIRDFEVAGVTVNAPPCDVSSAKALSGIFKQIQNTKLRLGGIIHAASVFDDALIRNLSADRINSVLASKAKGAWNLHELSLGHDPDFFVLYSSATTLFGNPGQANYVAANYMLESLSKYRKTLGLKSTCAAWGAISDVGFLARNEETRHALISRFGGAALTSEQALNELEQLMLSKNPDAAFINFDWKSIKRTMPSAKALKYEQQNNWLSRFGSDDDSDDFFATIKDLPSHEVQKLISDILTREISQILRLPIEKIDNNCSIYDLGMDSLMGMELLLAIEERFNTKLPLMSLTEGASINKISEKVQSKLSDSTNSNSDTDNDEIVGLATKHGTSLSSEQIGHLKVESS